MTKIKPIIDLFHQFREATGGDGLAAAFLTLAKTMQEEEQAERPVPSPAPDRMLSLNEAATYLGYTRNGLWRIVERSRTSHQGKYTEGPTLKFFQSTAHGPIRFKREWLDEFVAQHRIEPSDNEQVPCRGTRRASKGQISLREAFRG